MRKFLFIFFGFVVISLIVPIGFTQAGLVPCGQSSDDLATTGIDESQPCQLCHFFVLINSLIKFFLVPTPANSGFAIVPLIAALMFAMGGFCLVIAAGRPLYTKKAKDIITAAVVGLLIVYGSWLLISTILAFSGVMAFTGFGDWWEVQCALP